MVKARSKTSARKGLAWRLVKDLLIVQCLLMPALFIAITSVSRYALEEQFVDNLRGTTGLLVTELYDYDPVRNVNDIIIVLGELLLGGRIIYAEIELPSGSIITPSIAPIRPELTFLEDFHFSSHDDQVYFIAVPVDFNSYPDSAVLRLGFDEMPINESIAQTYLRTLFIIGAYVLFSLFLVALIGRRFVRPLNQLRKASRLIINGHTDTVFEAKQEDWEIYQLAQDLETMRQQLMLQTTDLEYLAFHDALTGLPNRALVHDRIEQALLMGQRQNTPFASLLMDLDRFKEINDTLGHATGDIVLCQTAERLRKTMRKSDTVSRLGGDEFLLFLPNTTEEQAMKLAKSVIQCFNEPFDADQQPVRISTSIGISCFPVHGHDLHELVRKADVAMYQAKTLGKGYCLYDSELDHHSTLLLSLSHDLDQGIRNNEFLLHYQPKVDLSTGFVSGAEVLSRWKHARHQSMLLPDTFIPLIEQNGLIQSLTQKVLFIVAENYQLWTPDPGFQIGVNLSAIHLQDPELPNFIEKLLAETTLPASALQLELTETAILQNPKRAKIVLSEICNMGVSLAIDDFGTGYSSLLHLKHLPLNEIKIDKSFVFNCVSNNNDAAIIKAMIRMAHDLGLVVTAEGVESQDVLNCLADMGCDKAQGYYFSTPLPFDEFKHWYESFPQHSDFARS